MQGESQRSVERYYHETGYRKAVIEPIYTSQIWGRGPGGGQGAQTFGITAAS